MSGEVDWNTLGNILSAHILGEVRKAKVTSSIDLVASFALDSCIIHISAAKCVLIYTPLTYKAQPNCNRHYHKELY